MSHLSEKPKPTPRPLRTRDLILQVLDNQALPISTRELAAQLHKLGPRPTPAGLKENLDELLRLGHIRREHDPETGPHWVRVPDNKPPLISDLQRGILEWLAANTPATAADMSPHLITAGILKPGDQAARTVGSACHGLQKRGELCVAGLQKTTTGGIKLWGLPGQAVSATAPKTATTPDMTAIERIEQSIDDISAALEQLRRDLRHAA